jgi:hypothetical protein
LASDHFLGYGMTQVFKDQDYSDMLIWKGLAQEGQHGVGNNMIHHGTQSQYAISFSALVAEGLEKDYLRPLHYVITAATPAEMVTNVNLNRGSQIPICMADWSQFIALTKPDANDIENVDRRQALNATISKISSELLVPKLQMRTSRQVASSFAGSFKGAVKVAGSELGNSVDFKYVWKKMILGITDRVLALYDNNATFKSEIFARSGYLDALYVGPASSLRTIRDSLSPLPDFTAYLAIRAQLSQAPNDAGLKASLAAAAAALVPAVDDAINRVDDNYSGIFTEIRSAAYNFALADFLVSQDLSAVVDIPAPIPDAHGANLNAVVKDAIAFAGFQLLMESFRGQILPDGKTLLENTLIVMHTELDREPFLTMADPGGAAGNAGTNHGYTTSMIMAGYGIRKGTVVGELHRGPMDVANFGLPQAYPPSVKYATPLPIDVKTGKISSGGRVITTKAIFPTILAIFGVPVPPQQITEFGPLAAVIKS